MYNAHPELVVALNSVLPTHYEMTLNSKIATPCISYMGIRNSVQANGDTIGYSNLGYQVKVWANDIALIMQYAQEIDDVLRPLGWRRTNYNELYDMNSSMIQGIMNYESLARENFD
jgi:hypothetical protein